MDASERRQARAAAVRLAVARWPSCWLAIRRRYLARVAERQTCAGNIRQHSGLVGGVDVGGQQGVERHCW